MNKEELKTLVAQMLREMGETTEKPEENQQDLADITQMDLRKLYVVDHPKHHDQFLDLKQKTPARLGCGRAGARYKTLSMLRFRADHAAAQDSVFSLVPQEFATKHGLVPVQTKCKDKDQYLTRPDLGRRFDQENQVIIQQTCGNHPKILLVIGDGLSATAIQSNAIDCAAAIGQGLEGQGITLGKTLFVEFCRVGASDHIGEITDAELVCLLVGERPGLVTAQSMSAYITYRPRLGTSESQRTVVSNIHDQGTPAVEAGAHIATLLTQMLEKKSSGVAFRQGAVG